MQNTKASIFPFFSDQFSSLTGSYIKLNTDVNVPRKTLIDQKNCKLVKFIESEGELFLKKRVKLIK